MLSHSTSCLLTAHVTPLRNSRLKTEMHTVWGQFVPVYLPLLLEYYYATTFLGHGMLHAIRLQNARKYVREG